MNNKPWLTEPNEVSWTDPTTGYECLIRRNMEMLFLCGYVKVSPDHPLMEKAKKLERYFEGRFSVHGSVTFSGEMSQGGYYVGFDCGHCGDLVPSMLRYGNFATGVHYRDMKYVQEECEQLALQIKEADTRE